MSEAEAKRLEIANRYGNPIVGPSYEYDPTRINLIGAQVTLPLPLFNTHQGEISAATASRTNTGGPGTSPNRDANSPDVEAALALARESRAPAKVFTRPNSSRGCSCLEDIERLRNKDKVDVPLNDARRKLLKIRDGYLDALWEVTQAEADLAAAVGDPFLATFYFTAQPTLSINENRR